jgi:cyclophilin family peptidyl-prolyl cis-trans isomerase
MWPLIRVLALWLGMAFGAAPTPAAASARAPEVFTVRLETSRGVLVLEVHRDWAPHGADRFYDLVGRRYYDGNRFFRVIAGRWAQFGIQGDPREAARWRARAIPDDPRKESNLRGTVAFAFAVPGGRTTQVFVNLGDNADRLDGQGFAPFARVVEGMEAMDALYAGYGEDSGGGIRAGHQEPLFTRGNAYLARAFPRLDYIRRARIIRSAAR